MFFYSCYKLMFVVKYSNMILDKTSQRTKLSSNEANKWLTITGKRGLKEYRKLVKVYLHVVGKAMLRYRKVNLVAIYENC